MKILTIFSKIMNNAKNEIGKSEKKSPSFIEMPM